MLSAERCELVVAVAFGQKNPAEDTKALEIRQKAVERSSRHLVAACSVRQGLHDLFCAEVLGESRDAPQNRHSLRCSAQPGIHKDLLRFFESIGH
jgi:hypothetical protein